MQTSVKTPHYKVINLLNALIELTVQDSVIICFILNVFFFNKFNNFQQFGPILDVEIIFNERGSKVCVF